MQKFLVEHKKSIVKLWYALLVAWLVFFLLTLKFLDMNQWLWLGRKSATLAIVVFWLTLTPGMLKRFHFGGIVLPIRTIMMLYRRQLGITMYVFALTHLAWVHFAPILVLGGNIWFFSRFELFGLTAFILLTPVFITSNEWSVRTLGHFWRTLHALVYIIVWVLFLHIALQGTKWQALGTLIVASLETFSLLWTKMNTAQPPPAPITPPQA